jgi:hypothetical protein
MAGPSLKEFTRPPPTDPPGRAAGRKTRRRMTFYGLASSLDSL